MGMIWPFLLSTINSYSIFFVWFYRNVTQPQQWLSIFYRLITHRASHICKIFNYYYHYDYYLTHFFFSNLRFAKVCIVGPRKKIGWKARLLGWYYKVKNYLEIEISLWDCSWIFLSIFFYAWTNISALNLHDKNLQSLNLHYNPRAWFIRIGFVILLLLSFVCPKQNPPHRDLGYTFWVQFTTVLGGIEKIAKFHGYN